MQVSLAYVCETCLSGEDQEKLAAWTNEWRKIETMRKAKISLVQARLNLGWWPKLIGGWNECCEPSANRHDHASWGLRAEGKHLLSHRPNEVGANVMIFSSKNVIWKFTS